MLLDAWERGMAESPVRRALLLLGAAWPDTPEPALAELPVGRRNERLMEMRARLFGTRLAGIAACPSCDARLDLAFDLDDIREPRASADVGDLTIAADGLTVRFRLPTSLDLQATATCSGTASARVLLLQRCVLELRCDRVAPGVSELPEAVVQEINRRMAEADPQADVQVTVSCAACGVAWQAMFDIASFLWGEVDRWARRMLHEVHVLASAYGWTEAEILRLGPWRRRVYLGLATR
jgi:hypothetical protein